MSPDEQPTILTSPPNGSRPASAGWQAPSVEEMQAMLPQYEIMEILGRGGMGAVYKGRQKSLKRLVAIKILPPDAADDEMKFVERFQNEAQTMAAMNHPAIVSVYDFGETANGLLYFIMEYVDGSDVHKLIQASGKLSGEHALAITAHVCDALDYAHKRGVIHRDIKPANILIDQEGHIKVADFGLAKMDDPSQTSGLTKTNMAMGTPDYVAPEVLSPGMVADHRADLYAVGVMLYQMLTGEVPRGMFKLPSQKGIGSDPRFDQIICKAMEQDREERYQSAMDVRRALDVILTTPQPKDDGTGIASASQIPQKPVAKGPRSLGEKNSPPPQRDSEKKPADKSVRAPAKKASATSTSLGIGGIVAVLGVAAFFVFSGKTKPASESASPDSSAAQSSTSPDSWTDRLGAMTWAAPWSMKDGAVAATTSLALQNLGSVTDGAIRIRARVAEGATAAMLKNPVLQPSVRSTTVRPGWRASYLFQAYMPGRATTLIYMEREDKKVAAEMPPVYLWKEKPLPPELVGKTEIEWEFRTIGDELSLWADGKLVASVHDSRLTSGGSKLQAYPGFEITRLETSGFTPDKAAEAKSGAPPNITNWQDVTVSVREKARAMPGFVVEEDGVRFPSGGPNATTTRIVMEAATGDRAVRVRYLGQMQINLGSKSGTASAFVLAQRDKTMFKRMTDKVATESLLPSVPHPAGFDADQLHELLLTVQGPLVRVWLDGRFVGDVQDDIFTNSTTALVFIPSSTVQKVETAALSASPSTTAPTTSASAQDFQGHRYQLVSGNFSWQEAKAEAEKLGGHLAVISSAEENDWAWKTFSTQLPPQPKETRWKRGWWLGASQTAAEKPWSWLTGESLSYECWGIKEPSTAISPPRYLWMADANKEEGTANWTVQNAWIRGGFLVEWDTTGG